MQHQCLAGASAAQLRSVNADPGNVGRLQKPEAGVAGRNQESIGQPGADVARRGMHVAALKQRAGNAADLFSQFKFINIGISIVIRQASEKLS